MSVGSLGQSVFVPPQALSALAFPAVTPSGQPVAVHITPHGAIVRGIGYPTPHHAHHAAPKSNDGGSTTAGFALGAGAVGLVGTIVWILTSSRAHIPFLGALRRKPPGRGEHGEASAAPGGGSNPSTSPGGAADKQPDQNARNLRRTNSAPDLGRPNRNGPARVVEEGGSVNRPVLNAPAGLAPRPLQRSASAASLDRDHNDGQDVAANVAFDAATEMGVEQLAQHIHTGEYADPGHRIGGDEHPGHVAQYAGENTAAQDHELRHEVDHADNGLGFGDDDLVD